MAKGNTVRLWRRSLIVLMVMLIAGFGLLIFRLVQLQIVEGETLQKGAVSQQLKDTTISAKRGTIYDCNMKPLAQSANVWTVVLEPAYLTDKEDQTLVANGLAEILGMEAQDIMDKMNPNSYYTILKKKVESDVKDAILQFKTDNEITNGIIPTAPLPQRCLGASEETTRALRAWRPIMTVPLPERQAG